MTGSGTGPRGRVGFRAEGTIIIEMWVEISIQCYLRTEEPKRGGDGIADDMGNDIFMGGVRFEPDFDDLPTQDQWYELVGGSGKIQIGLAFQPNNVRLLLLYLN